MTPNIVKDRPAETSTGAGAFAILIAHLLGVNDPDVLVALTIVLGLLPGTITLLVVNGPKIIAAIRSLRSPS